MQIHFDNLKLKGTEMVLALYNILFQRMRGVNEESNERPDQERRSAERDINPGPPEHESVNHSTPRLFLKAY